MVAKKKKANTSQSKKNSASKPRKRRYLELLGFIGTVIGIAVVVFQVGQYFGTKSAKRQEFKTFIEYIEQIREGIRIENVTCHPNNLYLGETCDISIRVINKTPYECDLWVGTSAIAKDGKEIWNTSQDRLVTITPDGITNVKRLFTFPNEAIEGIYRYPLLHVTPGKHLLSSLFQV